MVIRTEEGPRRPAGRGRRVGAVRQAPRAARDGAVASVAGGRRSSPRRWRGRSRRRCWRSRPTPDRPRRSPAGAAAVLGSERVVLFPAWESLPYEGISPGPLTAGRRARAAHRLRAASGPVSSSPRSSRSSSGSGSRPRRARAARSLRVDAVDHARRSARALRALGYARVDVVEHRGEFAVRGGIVDVFPATERRPARAEFFGDEIESFREFSPGTQLSTAQIEPRGGSSVPRAGRRRRRPGTRRARPRTRAASAGSTARCSSGSRRAWSFEGMEQAIPLLYDRLPFLADLLPPAAWVVRGIAAGCTIDRARASSTEADALAEAGEWPGPARDRRSRRGARRPRPRRAVRARRTGSTGDLGHPIRRERPGRRRAAWPRTPPRRRGGRRA